MEFKRKALAIAVMVASSTLTACGGSSSGSKDDTSTTPTNSAPTAVTLSANTVDENVTGVEVGTLSATDANAGDTFTFTTDNELFAIAGDKLSLKDSTSFDFEATETVALNVTVTDNGGLSHTQALTITVNDLLDFYEFKSKVDDATMSSVAYGGQTTRHALIAELKHYIGAKSSSGAGLAFDLEQGISTKDEVIAKLNGFYHRDQNAWDNFPITFTDAKQESFADLGSYKSLKDKVAGNDVKGQHKFWNGQKDEAGQLIAGSIEFSGWSNWKNVPSEEQTPHGLVQYYFEQIANNAMENPGGKRYVPGAEQTTENEIPVYVNYDGTDLNQLIQKFLLMSIAYSQSADDYFGHETEGKGFLTDNVALVKSGYTNLEHQFDEGFGYFGAARDYLSYSDDEIAGKVKDDESNGRLAWNGQHDTNGDGVIDLLSEKNFGNSGNAAKRDRGSKLLADGSENPNATDYTKQAMDAFLAGRKLINDNAGIGFTEAQLVELKEHRDIALDAWERSVVGTVIHYINDLRADLLPLEEGEEVDFVTAAKHFSELKGFALGLQFNPYSPLSDADFVRLHAYIEDAPALTNTPEFGNRSVAEYRVRLLIARDLLKDVYDLDEKTVANW
ncbi:DUF4856 domain-containing protein [Colwellia sp. D2M02]|uniref:DUF4856 domain-containing protein n=1 Tax=Colwellia sp. D2M02 TaxID=2841562 RepID=UPI001C09668F|nr:DUF4856 domain-containing protein [Colwellia sp. D2M02]MBU2894756.1 DUF4856 domain-containing protein [Colwellia sp. D2M02]